MPHNMDTLFVRPDGTAYTNTYWEEGTHEVTIFKNGKVIGGSDDLHGWGRNGGYAVTADDDHLYVGMVQGGCDGGNSDKNQFGLPEFPACETNWYAVGRYDLQGNPAPFNGGYGYKGHHAGRQHRRHACLGTGRRERKALRQRSLGRRDQGLQHRQHEA